MAVQKNISHKGKKFKEYHKNELYQITLWKL